jgi:hypothetical protein
MPRVPPAPNNRIDGPAFVYCDHDTGRVATIIG